MNSKIKERLKEFMLARNKILEDNQKRLDRINNYIDLLRVCKLKEADSLETKVFKLYLITGKLEAVAEYLNQNGYRIKTDSYIGERKYIPNDITFIIKEKNHLVKNKKLRLAVLKLKENNAKGLGMKWFYE